MTTEATTATSVLILAGYVATHGAPLYPALPDFTKTRIASHTTPAQASDDPWLRDAVDELENISQLVNGWDGEESIAPNPIVVDRARIALALVFGSGIAARRVLATHDGGIGVYCFERGADPKRGVRYFRIGLDPDCRTRFESGNLGAHQVETEIVGDAIALGQRIEEWASLVTP